MKRLPNDIFTLKGFLDPEKDALTNTCLEVINNKITELKEKKDAEQSEQATKLSKHIISIMRESKTNVQDLIDLQGFIKGSAESLPTKFNPTKFNPNEELTSALTKPEIQVKLKKNLYHSVAPVLVEKLNPDIDQFSMDSFQVLTQLMNKNSGDTKGKITLENMFEMLGQKDRLDLFDKKINQNLNLLLLQQ